jgi:hypothetical protein
MRPINIFDPRTDFEDINKIRFGLRVMQVSHFSDTNQN